MREVEILGELVVREACPVAEVPELLGRAHEVRVLRGPCPAPERRPREAHRRLPRRADPWL